MAWYKNKQLWSFVGGVAALAASQKFVNSGKAREVAVKSLAQGMKIRDDAQETYENIREDAKDICEEAKAKNVEE